VVGEQVQRVGGTVMITFTEVFEKNPHATLVVQSWFMSKMLESLDDNTVPEDFREMLKQQGVQKEHLIKMVEGSPRSLFDVLDEHEVVIQINTHPNFSYSINNETIAGSWTTRKEAEMFAVSAGLEMLENKIKES